MYTAVIMVRLGLNMSLVIAWSPHRSLQSRAGKERKLLKLRVEPAVGLRIQVQSDWPALGSMIPVRRARGSEGITCALRHQLPQLLCSGQFLLPEPSLVASLTESCILVSALQATGQRFCCWSPEKDWRCNAVNYPALDQQGPDQHKRRGTLALSSLVGCPQRPGWVALLLFRTSALSPRML